MKKILIPLDGTERSMHSIELVKQYYKPSEVKLILTYITKLFVNPEEYVHAERETFGKLHPAIKELEDVYDISIITGFVDPGKEILRIAEEENIDVIVMTKSTKKGLLRMIGSVTSHVVKHAKCIVAIVPE